MSENVTEADLTAGGGGWVVDADDAAVGGPVLVVEVHEHRVVRGELLYCISLSFSGSGPVCGAGRRYGRCAWLRPGFGPCARSRGTRAIRIWGRCGSR